MPVSCFAPAVVTKSQACKFVEENARYTDQEVDMMEALERCVLVESNFGQSGHIMRTSCACCQCDPSYRAHAWRQ